MAKVYKIWLHLEEIDEDADHYADIAEPVEVGRFDRKDVAETIFKMMEMALKDDGNALQEMPLFVD